ncbi:MAG: ScpA family protein [Dongiaceae bacterium]
MSETWPANDDQPAYSGDDVLHVELGAYEGPLDILLQLARQQKVDLAQLSILTLADQYLAFMQELKTRKLEIAADYLVMAAWLAYLKSRLLLPPEEVPNDEPSAEELSIFLQWQLKRLAAMQEAGQKIMNLPRFGFNVFARGNPEGIALIKTPLYQADLYELLSAYGAIQKQKQAGTMRIAVDQLFTVDEALDRLRHRLSHLPNWESLSQFLPAELREGTVGRSGIAATFVASLELARQGEAQLRQLQPFGPIYIRRKPKGAEE